MGRYPRHPASPEPDSLGELASGFKARDVREAVAAHSVHAKRNGGGDRDRASALLFMTLFVIRR